MRYIHTTDCYPTIKRNEVLTHGTTWINTESIMLREKKPVIKDHILYDSVHMEVLNREIDRDRR